MAASPVFTSAASGRPFFFPASASLLTQLRATPKLAVITPASKLEVRPAPEMVSSGILELDALTGGWPRGCLTEICGTVSSGRTSILLAALAQATMRGEACALVDASDALDPASAAAAGVEMGRLLWVRCGKPVLSSRFSVPSAAERKRESRLDSPQSRRDTETSNQKSLTNDFFRVAKFDRKGQRTFEQRLEQVLKVTDQLLQSNGFGMIILDLADIPVRSARRIPLASWFRFRRAVEHTPTVLLVIEQAPIAGSCSSVLVKVTGHRGQVSGVRCQVSGKKPSAFSRQDPASGLRSPVSGKKPPISEHSVSRAAGLTSDVSEQGNSMNQRIFSDQETMAARPSHTELLDQFEVTAELLRSRLERKPSQSVVNFRTRAKWAG